MYPGMLAVDECRVHTFVRTDWDIAHPNQLHRVWSLRCVRCDKGAWFHHPSARLYGRRGERLRADPPWRRI